jgi:hypothetical protein
MARVVAIGWVLCALLPAAVGCSCAEAWSVAEELGPDQWGDDAVLDHASIQPTGDRDRGSSEVEPEPSAPLEPTTGELAERIGSFVGELCMRMRRGNEKYVEQHVDLPIEVRLRDADRSGAAAYRDEVLDDAWELRMSGICADLTWLGAGMRIEPRPGGWRAVASGNGTPVELLIRQTPKGRLRLVRFRQL